MSTARMRSALLGWGAVAVLAVAGCSSGSSSHHPDPDGSASPSGQSTQSGQSSGIHQATASTSLRDGHFSDPYPITSGSTSTLSFSGTFKEVITCSGTVKPGCFAPTPVSVGFDSTQESDLSTHGLKVDATKSHHISQESNGTWDMVFCAVVSRSPQGHEQKKQKKQSKQKQQQSKEWNLIMHAHAEGGTGSVPTQWVADSVLVGSLTHSEPADYDGKYFDDDGTLYLMYSKRLSSSPATDGIVAQRLTSPEQPAATPPVTLLAPSTAGGGLRSESFFSPDQKNGFRLVETGNVTKVGGTYVMLYSTGSFDRPDYKIGVAYSDTFLPSDGSGYRKLTEPDTKGTWGKPGADEVDYILQSYTSDWPHYVRAQVQAPGVPSMVERDHTWYLFFAGYAPSEKASGKKGTFDPSHRQPYYVPLHVDIPHDAAVAKADPAQMRSWITART